MKRIPLVLMLMLLFLGVTMMVGAQSSPNSANVPRLPECPPTIDCLNTPTPHSSGNTSHPGDPDGDGIPNGIDQCPDDGGPSSNSGCPIGRSLSASNPQVVITTPSLGGVLLPFLPPDGNCVLATRTSEGVNVRNQPSIHSTIVGTLDPTVPYLVISILHDSEGTWYRVIPGWVAGRVIRLGGKCDKLPVIEERGATNSKPVTLAYPEGFKLALDKGAAPGEDTPQGYCAPSFGIDLSTPTSAEKLDFAFGDGSVRGCVQLDSDAHGFVLSPPNLCDATQICTMALTHWYVGVDPDSGSPLLLGWIENGLDKSYNRKDGSISTPESDQNGVLPSVLLSWALLPPPCKTGDQSCISQPLNFVIHWGLSDPPEPDKPGITIAWGLSDPPDPDKPGIMINFGLTDPPDPDKPGIMINFGLTDPPDPDKPGIMINFGLTDPPEPDFQGFGINGVADVAASVRVEFSLPAVQ